jgi:predicted transcriptional regulator
MNKRTFKELRKIILKVLNIPKSTRQISREINAEWRTTKKQLMWLKAEDKVEIASKSDKEIIWKRKD